MYDTPRIRCSPDTCWDVHETESCSPCKAQDLNEMDCYRLRDEFTPHVVPEVDYLSQLKFIIDNPVIDYYAMFDNACGRPGLGPMRNIYTSDLFIRFHGPKIREGLDNLAKVKEEKSALVSSSDDSLTTATDGSETGGPNASLYKAEGISVSPPVITAPSTRPRHTWAKATKVFAGARAKVKSLFSISSTSKCAKHSRGTSGKFNLSRSPSQHVQLMDSRASSSANCHLAGPVLPSWGKAHKAIDQRPVTKSRLGSDMSTNAIHSETPTFVDEDGQYDADLEINHPLHISTIGEKQIIEPALLNAAVSSSAITPEIQHPFQIRTMPIPDYLRDVPKTKLEWEKRAGLHSYVGLGVTTAPPMDDPFLQQPNDDCGKQPQTFVDFLCSEVVTFFFALSIIVLFFLLPWIFLGATPILIIYFFGRELVNYLYFTSWDRKSDLIRIGETLAIGVACICVLHLLNTVFLSMH